MTLPFLTEKKELYTSKYKKIEYVIDNYCCTHQKHYRVNPYKNQYYVKRYQPIHRYD
jgi:hypothetical protein